MILIVGLGNPGKKYKKTRHNVGFQVIDELINSEQLTVNKKQEKFNAAIWEGTFDNQKIILAKPLTFMNESGKSVKKLIGNWKLEIGNLIVMHDDIDLPLETIRVSKNITSAGHKGIQSIIDEMGSKNFVRIRIGIKPTLEQGHDTENFVLTKFSKEEKKLIQKAIKLVIKIIEKGLKQGLKKTTVKIFQ